MLALFVALGLGGGTVLLDDRTALPGMQELGAPDADGVITVELELVPADGESEVPPAAAQPIEGPTVGRPGTGDGAIAAVPTSPSTLLLVARVDADYVLRFGADGGWGEWIAAGGEIDEAPDTAASADRAIGPYRVPDGADAVEVVLVDGSDRSIEARFLLDPPEQAQPVGLDLGPTPTVAGARQVGAGERPTIMPRSAWASDGWASGNRGCEDGPWYADNLRAVIIHHTVTTNDYQPSEVDNLLRAVHYAHVEVNGWCDVGYNFLVDRFGTIWEGRSGGVDRPVIGGHAKGFNTATVGVALLGQHHPGASPTPSRPTTAAELAVEALAAWKLGRYGIDPSGTTWLRNHSTSGMQRLPGGMWHLVPTVLGHRDVGVTSCPGNHGIEVVRALPAALEPTHPGPAPYHHEARVADEIGSGFVAVDRDVGLRAAGAVALPGIGAPPDASAGPAPVPSPSPVAVAARRTGTLAAGYVVHRDGVVTAFGGATPVAGSVTGGARPVDVAVGDEGGWVVTADGAVVGFGGRPDRTSTGGRGLAVVGAALDADGVGYLLEVDGGLRSVGGAPAVDSVVAADVVDLAVRPNGGGWVLTGSGDLVPFGSAPAVTLSGPRGPDGGNPVRAIVASASGYGGWLMTADGQLWPFGDERLVLGVSTDAIERGIVDVAAVEPVVPASHVTGPAGRYLGALIELFLDRPAVAADYDHWDARLTFGGGDRRTITTGLARSDEWAGVRVDELYRRALGRSADEEGRRYWLGRMADGLPLSEVGVSFYGSPEYARAAGSTEAYVSRLYRELLGREPDADGLDYWAGLLDSGDAGPAEVAAGFYASIESRRGRVTALYREVLGRGPDADGLGHWAQQLLEVDDVELAAELAASDEFHARALR